MSRRSRRRCSTNLNPWYRIIVETIWSRIMIIICSVHDQDGTGTARTILCCNSTSPAQDRRKRNKENGQACPRVSGRCVGQRGHDIDVEPNCSGEPWSAVRAG